MDLHILLYPSRSRVGESRLWLLFLLVIFCISLSSFLGSSQLPHASCESLMDSGFGNITVINKPVPTVVIDEGDVPVGEALTYAYNLVKGHRYHVYLSGDWVDPKNHKTDYDLFVYKISGVKADFISSHTKSAGLLEQVGNDEF